MVRNEPPHPSSQIAEQDFLSWKHNPVSKVVLQYLLDYRKSLHVELLARFENNTLLEKVEQEIRGRCLTLAELSDLQFASIQEFYKEEDQENAAETTEGR